MFAIINANAQTITPVKEKKPKAKKEKVNSTIVTDITPKKTKKEKASDVTVSTSANTTATIAEPKKRKEKKEKLIKTTTDPVITTPVVQPATTHIAAKPSEKIKTQKVVNTSNSTSPVINPPTAKNVPPITSNTTKIVTPKVTPAAPIYKTADQSIGTDTKGRTIYQGKKGGHYYINQNGNKEYIKQ
jgi:hypothetical protein